MGEPRMDDLVGQLRRYADAAEQQVPIAEQVPPRRSGRSTRRVLAAVAAVALVAGATGTYLATSDDQQLRTTPPADDVPAPAPGPIHDDLEEGCPAVRAEGPRIDDLQLMLPLVSSGHRTRSDAAGVELVVEPGAPEQTTLRATELSEPRAPGSPPEVVLPGATTDTTVWTCDPFGGSARRTDVPAAAVESEGTRQLVFELGGQWRVSLSTDARTGADLDDLLRYAAGMSWPAPAGAPAPQCVEPNAELAIDDEPSGGHRVTVVPEGYEHGPVEIVDTPTPGLEVEVDRRHVLPLRRPDGASIDVVLISSYDPVGVIEGEAGEAPTESIEVPRCGGPDGDDDTSPITALRSLTDDRILVGAREWEWGGWMVIGTGGATNEDVLSVVQGLRGGALG